MQLSKEQIGIWRAVNAILVNHHQADAANAGEIRSHFNTDSSPQYIATRIVEARIRAVEEAL
jgi:hypothetical protein